MAFRVIISAVVPGFVAGAVLSLIAHTTAVNEKPALQIDPGLGNVNLDSILDSGVNNPGTNTSISVFWSPGTVVRQGCTIHPTMQVWSVSLDTDMWAAGAAALGFKHTAVYLAHTPADGVKLLVRASKHTQFEVARMSGYLTSLVIEANGNPVGKLNTTVDLTLAA